MGMIGRWIDGKCQSHPDVMRRVLGRRFGDLGVFIEDTEDGVRCGCLIGSWGLERDASWTRTIREPINGVETDVGCKVFRLTQGYSTALGGHYAGRKRRDPFVIRLLKQRIRKSLGLSLVETPETESVAA